MSKKHAFLAVLTALTLYTQIHTLDEKKSLNIKTSVEAEAEKIIEEIRTGAEIKKRKLTNHKIAKHVTQKETTLDKIKKVFKPHVAGYIKHESYWDSRQVVGFDNDQCLAFPEPQLLDSLGNDINAKGQFTMIDIETFLHIGIDGPEILGAKSYGQIEANFFGLNEILNLFTLYTAIIKLSWERWELIMGEWWNPMFLLQDYPRTVQFNTGAPIAPFSRGPGIYATYHHDKKFDLILAAMSQVTFVNDGPDGFSADYLRNAIVPRLDAKIHYYFQKHACGLGIDFKRIKPRLSSTVNDKTFKVNESLNSISAEAYLALHFPSVNVRTQIMYAENTVDLSQIGGYAVHSIDPATGKQTYKNLRTVGWWLDVDIVKNKKVNPGFFIGYIRNIGASDCIIPNEVDMDGNVTKQNVFGFGENIRQEFRIAPRIKWNIKWVQLALELDYTSAGFGTVKSNGKIEDVTTVGNTRLIFAAYYTF